MRWKLCKGNCREELPEAEYKKTWVVVIHRKETRENPKRSLALYKLKTCL